ncbi:hypothetical protein IDM40_14870 [Nocardiopsis sp. HNM0947]|uniref:Secreted protein n=1 Tax=Nocardiopsis coralli TaxID=2772213 RepID=A0ABR9P815_9ACTN|nr:hypothetical protein [Nocardiopsis coralli]
MILIGGLVALAVSSGSGEYGTLAEDQCHTILPESTFDRVSDGESVYVDGEYEEYSGTDDSHLLECEVSFGSSDNPEHAVHVMAEIHEVDSSGHREMTDDLTEGLEELEDNLEPGELGRPSGDTDLGSAASGDMIWQHTSQGEEGAVLAMPSDGEYAPDIAGAYVRDQNASFAVTAIFPQSSDFEPEDGMSDAESLAGDVISAIRSVNEAP